MFMGALVLNTAASRDGSRSDGGSVKRRPSAGPGPRVVSTRSASKDAGDPELSTLWLRSWLLRILRCP